MKAPSFLALAIGLFVSEIPLVYSSLASLSSIAPAAGGDDSTISSTTYIVELQSAANPGPNKRSSTPHEEFYESLRRKDVSFTSGQEWHVEQLFVGLVLTITDPADLQAVQNSANVVAVRPCTYLHTPPPSQNQVVTSVTDPSLPPDTQSTHVMTGVDKVHAEGNFGQGVNIGIIDSGVDYLNPALGGGIGPNYPIKGGYDFVGDAFTGGNDPVPDNDPMDTCNGHGTHVAGIIAAQPGNQYNITGVAYKSNIYAYRVIGCKGTVPDPITISALLRAYQDGMDVITLSLGLASGWTESTTGVVASRLVAKGKVVTASVGNDAAIGAWYPSAPATGQDVIAVGSVDNTMLPVTNATLSDGHAPITYFAYKPFPVTGSLPVYATSTDITIPNDACNPLPSSTPNLANYIVVIRRGGCTLATKFANAAAKGGRYFFIYNNGAALGYVDAGGYIGALISAEDGAYLVNAFSTGSNLRVSFPQTGSFDQFRISNVGLVSVMSTIGPTYDMRIGPSVLAPGVNILSTFPRALGSFALASGTSMSTPFVAGTAALVLKAKGKSAAKGVKKLLQNTAGMVPSTQLDNSPFTTVAQQGAGLVNAYHAIHAQSTVSASELLVNDTAYQTNYQAITISNPTTRSVTYTITHSPALTVKTVDNSNALPVYSPLPTLSQTASVSFTSTQLTVKQKRSSVFMVTIKPPTGVDATTHPVYSGFVTISSSLGETFSLPYLGVASKLKDMQILDTSSVAFDVPLPIMLNAGNGLPPPDNPTYTLQGSDYPAILYRRAAGTPSLLADLVKSDIQLSGTISTSTRKRGLLWDWLSGIFGPGNNGRGRSTTFAAVKTVGPISNIPYTPRHQIPLDPNNFTEGSAYDFIRVNQYLNATSIPNGQYKLLMRTLKITGDPSKEEDYEAWLSPAFTVNKPSQATTTVASSSSTSAATAASAPTTTSSNSSGASSTSSTSTSSSHH